MRTLRVNSHRESAVNASSAVESAKGREREGGEGGRERFDFRLLFVCACERERE